MNVKHCSFLHVCIPHRRVFCTLFFLIFHCIANVCLIIPSIYFRLTPVWHKLGKTQFLRLSLIKILILPCFYCHWYSDSLDLAAIDYYHPPQDIIAVPWSLLFVPLLLLILVATLLQESKAKQSKAKQSKAERNKAKQSKSKVKQGQAKQRHDAVTCVTLVSSSGVSKAKHRKAKQPEAKAKAK